MSAGQHAGVDKSVEGKPCLLLVEDEPMQRRVLGRLIRQWGYDFQEAEDGPTAADRLGRPDCGFALVLLDIMLPGIDGVEVARIARTAHAALPIVACSAAFTPQIQGELAALGVRDFLHKPFDAPSLRAIIERYLCPARG